MTNEQNLRDEYFCENIKDDDARQLSNNSAQKAAIKCSLYY